MIFLNCCLQRYIHLGDIVDHVRLAVKKKKRMMMSLAVVS